MKIIFWKASCKDCDFVTGFASIQLPDGRGITFSGAGCRENPRRTPDVVKKKVNDWIEENQ